MRLNSPVMLLILLLSVLFLVGCGSSESKGQVYNSLDEVKALGKPMKCVWENPINKGTFWAFDGKSKTESLVGPTTFFLSLMTEPSAAPGRQVENKEPKSVRVAKKQWKHKVERKKKAAHSAAKKQHLPTTSLLLLAT